MIRLTWALALTLAVVSVVPAFAQTSTQPATANAAAATEKRPTVEVPVRRVVLFSSGVGFFQHAGTVNGNAASELRFKTDQINDVLKSLVVTDADAGRVTSITYPSQNPVSKTLKSFQIDISSNPTLADILNQIRGAKVKVQLADETVSGTILGVESKERPAGSKDDQKVVKTWHLNIIGGGGIRSVALDDVRSLTLEDAALQSELDQALAALAQARDKDKKPVIVNFDGTGERRVALGYVVETPVWKTSYRLILPEESSKDGANLMGWAIVENQTDNDWNDVTLDLVGGRPISFIEDLYQPLYVPRPVVQPKTYASLKPQTYEEGMDAEAQQKALGLTPGTSAGVGSRGAAGGFGGGGGIASRAAPAAAAPMPPMSLAENGRLADFAAQANYAQGIASVAEAAKVGEMFQYSVPNVSLARQRSSMIPIITDKLPIDRVSIYNESVLPRNPLRGVRLKNDSKNYLLAGPVTVLDMTKRADNLIVQSYAGDASIDDVPPGQDRLLSYAVDQDVLVDASKHDGKNSVLTGVIVNGVLRVKYLDRVSQVYAIQNKSDHEKTLIVEHPRAADFELKQPEKPLEKTDKLYRIQKTLAAKGSGTVEVSEERTRWEEMALLPMDVTALEFWMKNEALPESVKKALGEAATRQRNILALQRQKETADQNRTSILQDEENIRRNIQALPANSSRRDEAVNDLAAKDTELKDTTKTIRDLQGKIEQARQDLEKYLSTLSLEVEKQG
jgi:hypothetical protein